MKNKKSTNSINKYEKKYLRLIKICKTVKDALEIINAIYADGFEDGSNEGKS